MESVWHRLGQARGARTRAFLIYDGCGFVGNVGAWQGRMSQKNIGASFEIKVDGKTRSYRDTKETAIEAGEYLKQMQPKGEVSVHDLRDNSVTVID